MKLNLAPSGGKVELELELFPGETSCDKFLCHSLIREELLRKRCVNDAERYVETFRRSAVDPTPQQVDPLAFGLSRLHSAVARLCDEVGLSKTREPSCEEGRCENRWHRGRLCSSATDVSTFPGMREQSVFPRGRAASGVGINSLLSCHLERFLPHQLAHV